MEKRKTRLIVSKEVTDEQIDQAEKILDAGVDPNWDMSFGSMYIGVTGRHQVYYTLWKYAPRAIMNPMIYLGNLSTDIIEAAKKAKKRAGRQPVYFDDYETLKGMQGAQRSKGAGLPEDKGRSPCRNRRRKNAKGSRLSVLRSMY